MRFFRVINLRVRHDFCFVRKQFLISHAVWFWSCKHLLREGKGSVERLQREMEVLAAVVRVWWYLWFRERLAAERKSRFLKEGKGISCPSTKWLSLLIYFSGISPQLPGWPGPWLHRLLWESFSTMLILKADTWGDCESVVGWKTGPGIPDLPSASRVTAPS